MVDDCKLGFAKHVFAPRYDVFEFQEDAWHNHAARHTAEIVTARVGRLKPGSRVLNAGSGIYSLGALQTQEVRVDLFEKPLKTSDRGVCADIQMLPFTAAAFDLVVCVGEVIGYCDPAAAIRELARVLAPGGWIICDFASSRGFRRWFTGGFARAADVVISEYNGTPEKTWVYDPGYIENLLCGHGIALRKRIGTHAWSGLGRRLGMSAERALQLQRGLVGLPLPSSWAELVTFVGEKP